jgi:hypothetical protein
MPSNGRKPRPAYLVFALVKIRRMAVLKNYTTKMEVMMALVCSLSVWKPIQVRSESIRVLKTMLITTIDIETT